MDNGDVALLSLPIIQEGQQKAKCIDKFADIMKEEAESQKARGIEYTPQITWK